MLAISTFHEYSALKDSLFVAYAKTKTADIYLLQPIQIRLLSSSRKALQIDQNRDPYRGQNPKPAAKKLTDQRRESQIPGGKRYIGCRICGSRKHHSHINSR
jgi:hypothetical protein